MNKIGKQNQNSQNKKRVNKIGEAAALCYKRAKYSIRGGYSLHFQKFPTAREQASSS